METRAGYVMVGSFVVLAMVVLAGFMLWLAGTDVGAKTARYGVYFTGSVTGLSIGSPVRLRGVPFGTVTDIRIDPKSVERVEVILETPAEPPVPEDAIAVLELQGLTGAAYVQITGGTSQARPLQVAQGADYPIIPSRGSVVGDILEAAPRLLGQLMELTEQANRILGQENQEAVAATLANIRTFSDTLAGQGETLATTLGDAQALVADLRVAADKLTTTLEDEIYLISDEVTQTSASIRSTAQSFMQTSDEVRGFVAENRTAVRDFTGGGLYQTGELVSELRELISNLNAVTARIERDPRDFLLGGSGSGVSTP